MATQIPNEFTEYELEEDEEIQGTIFNQYHVMRIQNILSAHMRMKMDLKLDMQNPHAFVQEEASLEGKISILRTLLADSQYAIDLMARRSAA